MSHTVWIDHAPTEQATRPVMSGARKTRQRVRTISQKLATLRVPLPLPSS